MQHAMGGQVQQRDFLSEDVREGFIEEKSHKRSCERWAGVSKQRRKHISHRDLIKRKDENVQPVACGGEQRSPEGEVGALSCERFSVPFCTQSSSPWMQRTDIAKSGFSKEN